MEYSSYPSYSVIYIDTFSVVISEQSSIKCMVTIHQKGLWVEPKVEGRVSKLKKINASDIIGCHVFENFIDMVTKRRIGCIPAKNRPPSAAAAEAFKQIINPASYLCVYAYPLKQRLKGLWRVQRRERCIVTLKIDNSESKEENLETAKKWQTALLWVSRGVVTRIPPSPPTSRNLLILVNPCSGPGKALTIFKEQIAPLLTESDTHHQLLVTDRMNCGRDFIRNSDLSIWDGIVIVSGDGLIYEVINGIMERPDWESSIKIPIGVIPGGSGNGLAFAVCYALGESFEGNVITSAALNIVRGRLAPMDIIRVQTPTENIYSFLSVGWGIMADIDIESERLRAFGGARFTVWALVRAIGLRQYPGRISYLPVKGYVSHVKTPAFQLPKMTRSKTLSPDIEIQASEMKFSRSFSHLGGDRRKSSVADVVEVAFEASQVLECYDVDQENFPPQTKTKQYKKNSASSNANQQDWDLKQNNYDQTDLESMDEVDLEESNLKSSEDNFFPFVKETTELPAWDEPVPNDWTVVEGEFVLVYVSHVSHISADAMFAPDAKLDDGLMWLVMIKAGVTRAQVIQFLLSLEDGSHVRIPFVDCVPVTAFRLEPFTKDGYLTVDGEVIDCTPIQAHVLPSIARIMTR